MQEVKHDTIRQAVRKAYGEVAEAGGAWCGCDCGCGSTENPTPEQMAVALGYSDSDASSVPEGANMGLGCGNPQAIASLKPGETVLDLGSGGGFDCFLAARAVGERGHVIGVDMTPEMIGKARENTEKTGLNNVEFRLGEIENLPVADNSVDVIMSNCVINLSPEKTKVFKDAFRALKPGGRLAVADVVATAELPDHVRNDLALHANCIAGAVRIHQVEAMLTEVGFIDVSVTPVGETRELVREWAADRSIGDFVVSASIEGLKPQM